MKQGKLVAPLEIILLTVLFGVTIHAPFVMFFGSIWPDLALEIKAWKELALLVAGILSLVLIQKHGDWRNLLSDRLIQLSLAFIGLHLLLIPFTYTGLLPTVAGLMIDLRFIVFMLLCLVVSRYRVGFLRKAGTVIAASALVVVSFGLLQLTVLPDDVLSSIGYSKDTIRPFTTIDSNSDYIRIQSTMRGPNPLGALMVIYISFIAAFVARNRIKRSLRFIAGVLFASLSSVALLIGSFSRSALGGALLAVAVVASQAVRVTKRSFIVLASLSILAVASLGVLSSTDFYSNVVLHEDPESTVEKKSNNEHVVSLIQGSKRVLAEPFGAGVGSTGSASLYDNQPGPVIENQYLFVAHESGWFGLILFLALFVVILQRLWHLLSGWSALGLFASGVGLAAIGLLLPVWVDETVALTWWGLVGVIIGSRYDKRTRQQKTTRAT